MVYINIYFNTGVQGDEQWHEPPQWTANTSFSAIWGEGVKPTTSNGHNYILSQAGTTGSSDPFSSSDKNWDVITDGDETTGVKWVCQDPFTNPTEITGKPFGHGFRGSLYYMYYLCRDPLPSDYIDSTYLSGSTYDIDTLSSQHEVATIRYVTHDEGDLQDGHEYTRKEIWKDGSGNVIAQWEYTAPWDGNYTYHQTGGWIGWTPCWVWPWGSLYNGSPEITEGSDTGTSYSVTVELWDGSTLMTSTTKTFTVKNLHHTIIHWNNIGDVTGATVGGYFGMKASEYVHDLGLDTWDTQWYRQKNKSNHDKMKVDGMEETTVSVVLYVFRSGYVKSSRACPDVTDKDINNGPYDFTVPYHLQASVVGYVHEGTDVIPNANVWGERSGAKYGCKSNADGMFALPMHTGGTYTIKAAKNNHDVVTSDTTITQSGDHPDTSVSRSFTLPRTTDYPQGVYAHLNSLAVDGQSVIIIDDPVTGDGDLIIT